METVEVGIQVVGKKGKDVSVQTVYLSLSNVNDIGTQWSACNGSYQRNEGLKRWTYDRLKDEVLSSKENVINWLMENTLMVVERLCPQCKSIMKLVKCSDRSDGFKWECRKQIEGKRHKIEVSIRKDSWFEGSNLTIDEVLKLTYWWCRGSNATGDA